jgi:hypothetical protein
MSDKDFRKELVKLMPGYKWTVHKSTVTGIQHATGVQTSGFNRTSTLEVVKRLKYSRDWYEVRSSGFGKRSPWLGEYSEATLARALRGLQSHYQAMAGKYSGHAAALQLGRTPADEDPYMQGAIAGTQASDRTPRTVSRPAGAAASEANGAPREAKQ